MLDLLPRVVYQIKHRLKRACFFCRGIAQLVEHRSPKPRVVSSNLTAPANKQTVRQGGFLLAFREIDENSRGSELDKEEPGETEVSPFLRRRSGGATAQPIVCPCQRKQRVCEESQVFMF